MKGKMQATDGAWSEAQLNEYYHDGDVGKPKANFDNRMVAAALGGLLRLQAVAQEQLADIRLRRR